ncbi:VOC family protein [Palleronia aestuarii]|nr:VOC family protein [Palleronia aestuarii]
MAALTLAVVDPSRSRDFYADGFGWVPVFEAPGIIFYQMNGFVLGLYRLPDFEEDANLEVGSGPGGVAMAHNVATENEVVPLMERLLKAGGRLLRPADAPPHGGFRGYVADPDGHAWEIAWNPAWPIDGEGHVTFGA